MRAAVASDSRSLSPRTNMPQPTPPAPEPVAADRAVRRRRHRLGAMVAAFAAIFLLRCAAAPDATVPERSIVACGRALDIGTRVVSWLEADGYDAYRRGRHFTADEVPDGKLRYEPVRGGLPDAIAARARERGLSLADLQRAVHLFVIHFDVCGTSRQCFKVLHDVRCLSVHFLLDVDGTIYQTLDLREKAHHATIANDASIGVEIAHPGCWPQPLSADMRRWYERDEQGWRMRLPPGVADGVRTPGFVARPARAEIVSGEVHGRTYWQFDYTPQQYAALAHLCAGLAALFPRIRLDAPRDATGAIRTNALAADELLAFDGIVGHFHVQTNKQDPGPAFQWDRVLDEARTLRSGMRP
ncbi:MAG: N-acetylmuramoyl-L-alanine amidase [Planctomycetes bacterium]|nr:N-acetylmuramoyl-L-alanine amidase [Planctomycetota bacterium]